MTSRRRINITMAGDVWARLTVVAEWTGQPLSRLLEALGVQYLEQIGPLTFTDHDLERWGMRMTVTAPRNPDATQHDHDPDTTP